MASSARQRGKLVSPFRDLYAGYGYMSAFTRRKRVFPSLDEALRVKSKSAVERRIVVPIDDNNWIRALEIVRSSYGREGCEPKHYQQIIRCMVSSVGSRGPEQRTRSDIGRVLDQMREEFYEADPADYRAVNTGVWVTLIWAYCELGLLDEALEAVGQVSLRFRLSRSTRQHMAELLLPVCAAQGRGEDANRIVATLVDHKTSSVNQWLLEATSRAGEWERALSMIGSAEGRYDASSSSSPPQQPSVGITALFSGLDAENSTEEGIIAPSAADGGTRKSDSTRGATLGMDAGGVRTSGAFAKMTRKAVASLCVGAARENRWIEALALYDCWKARCGEISGSPQRHVSDDGLDVVRHVLNTLSFHQKWCHAIQVYSQHFSPDKKFDHVATNMLFHAFPERCEEDVIADAAFSNSSSGCPQFTNAEEIVRCYQSLVFGRDDFTMTNWVSGVVAPSMVQLGMWARSLGVLRNAPLLQGKVLKSGGRGSQEPNKVAERRLVQTVYALHDKSVTSLECHYYTLWQWPFAFPREVFRNLPPRSEMPQLVATLLKTSATDSNASKDEETVYRDLLSPSPKSTTARRPSRHSLTTSTASYEREQDEAMKANTVALAKRPLDTFFRGDADADPRPVPKGIFDSASGWSYFSRGGEKAFTNCRGLAHPLSAKPKYMKARYDISRGWNPRLNSSFAHRTPLKKYRKNAAV